jgi:hypothetical protein
MNKLPPPLRERVVLILADGTLALGMYAEVVDEYWGIPEIHALEEENCYSMRTPILKNVVGWESCDPLKGNDS